MFRPKSSHGTGIRLTQSQLFHPIKSRPYVISCNSPCYITSGMRTALAQPRPTTAPHLRPLATQHPSKNNTAHYKANPPHPNPGSVKSRPIPGFRTNPGFTSPLSNPAVTGPNHTPPKYPLTPIANSNTLISHCNMRLGEKIRYLREVEGALRGLDRAMTQLEIAHAINERTQKAFFAVLPLAD
jgi:hypothetical protein